MTHDEAMKMTRKLVGLFPTTTEIQGKQATEEFKRFSLADVDQAITEHHRIHDFVNWPQLYEGCRASAAARLTGSQTSVPEQSHADIIRSIDPQLRPVRNDLEVILRSFRKEWHACGQNENYREMIGRQCRCAIMGTAMGGVMLDAEIAGSWADSIFGSVAYMQQVINDLRTNCAAVTSPLNAETPWQKNDVASIREHFEAAWRGVLKDCPDEKGQALARAYILTFARMALAQVNVDGQKIGSAEVDEAARSFVGLEPGQRIPQQGIWNTTYAAKTSQQALEELARHEDAALPAPAETGLAATHG